MELSGRGAGRSQHCIHGQPLDDLVDGLLAFGQALVELTERSLGAVTEDVTLAQYRVLAQLARRGDCRLPELADALGLERSTAMRMSDRLASKELVRRQRLPTDGRAVGISLTDSGWELVDEVSCQLQSEVAALVKPLPSEQQRELLAALRPLRDSRQNQPSVDTSMNGVG